ncbi:MAG: phenylalanine--tRNA ligase subunit beta [Opitutales bacterium]|nr:phenylalanine--tRNA ligase subunit beta [Opitutales bacterium]NRA26064.1 phenylalanine--tRNA ligase subunit beta [Opitutales bacterium]
MKISLNWIRDYIDLQEPIDRIEEALTLIGFEVEGVEQTGLQPLEKCVIGKILARDRHPDADRLGVCAVDVGDGVKRQIVCGATNYVVNDLVPVALPGCVLPGNFKIKKSKLRGVVSEGMMCSAKELGQGEDHEGLMILTEHPEAKIGMPINDLLTDNDVVFDVEVTPNRPDCLSHVGMARELAAYFDLELSYPEVKAGAHDPELSESQPLIEGVNIEAEERCQLYHAFSIQGVNIGPSPEWLQQRLEAIGLRPINNVVDVTNYVLHELGQPLHAFDRKKISGDKLIVRLAKSGEKITTLDEKERTLSERTLVIADATQPLVIAGVMGSQDAEVDDSTVDVVLEAAYFEPSGIRRTGRQLILSTDSSYRYERGVDSLGVEFAALRAIDLILETAGGRLVGLPIIEGSALETITEIELKPQFIRERLGFGPDDKSIQTILERLELDVEEAPTSDGDPTWTVRPPSFRSDLERPVDLVEEFLRIYGTDKIPQQDVQASRPFQPLHPMAAFVERATQLLIGQQFSETMSFSLRSQEEVTRWLGHATADDLELANPLTSDQSHLRPTLIPGLLETLKFNASRGTGAGRFFEIGRVFREDAGRIWEALSVAFVIYQDPRNNQWKELSPVDFFTVKGQFQQILNLADIPTGNHLYRPTAPSKTWKHGHAAEVGDLSKRMWQGKVGLIDPRLTKDLGIEGLVYAGSLVVRPEFLDNETATVRFKQMSQFPAATKDLALIVDETTLAEAVRLDLHKIAKASIDNSFVAESVDVFDVYTGEGVEAGKKSLAFSISFRAPDRTLGDKEISRAFDAIQKQINEETPYAVRS